MAASAMKSVVGKRDRHPTHNLVSSPGRFLVAVEVVSASCLLDSLMRESDAGPSTAAGRDDMVRGGSRGRKKRTLRDVTRDLPNAVQAKEVVDTFANAASPIVTAILGVAIIETELDPMLRSRFAKRDDEAWKKLTEDIGPLSSFNSKIVTAYAMGIINDVVRDNLHLVRRIRNTFAHAKVLIDFSNDEVLAELRAIRRPKSGRGRLYREFTEIGEMDDPTAKYINLCFMLASQLVSRQTKLLRAQGKRLKGKVDRLRANHLALLQSAGYQNLPQELYQAF